MDQRKHGIVQIQMYKETAEAFKALAASVDLTLPRYFAQLLEQCSGQRLETEAEREVDQKIRTGDFSESRRGRPKEPRVEVSPTGKWLEPTWNDWKTWQQMRQDGSWEAYIVAYLAAHGREFDGDDFWRSNQTFLMKNAGRLRG